MEFSLTLPVHTIPLWFLVLSMFLPRICILLAWFQHNMPQYIPSTVGLIPILVWALVPRIVILFWIYSDQGITIWFLLHAVALLLAWGDGGRRVVTRRRVAVVE